MSVHFRHLLLHYRLIHTSRDLAAYLPYDALYEPYFIAYLLMLPICIGYHAGLQFGEDEVDSQTWLSRSGGPHILSFLAEVFLKAVKGMIFQNFAMLRISRPETVAGWIDCW